MTLSTEVAPAPTPEFGTRLTQPSRAANALNRWSGSFFRLTLPSELGTKARIIGSADEGAKILSVGMYVGRRTAEVVAIPYDGSRHDGHTPYDKSAGSLWVYKSRLPSGLEPVEGETFTISLGQTFKCHTCRGQGRVRCTECGGKVRWREEIEGKPVERVCKCGDGHELCHTCTGFGEMLKVLRVSTRFTFDEKRARDYNGRLPEALLMSASGRTVFEHVVEFDKRATVEAMESFDAAECDAMMAEARSELKREASEQVSAQSIDPNRLHELVDGYFAALPNLVAAGKRLEREFLPLRLRAQVVDVPLQAVRYEYKGKTYSAYLYGNEDRVWPDGGQPREFTSKAGMLLGLVALLVIGMALVAFLELTR
jgi:hypothetical protein